jgi:restriction endonuclease S subunit
MNYYFQSPVAVSKLVNSQSDSARANISLGDIRNLTICLPPLPEQKAIAAAISKWDRGLRQLSELIAAKVHFKQGLIQQLLTGMRRFRAFANRVHEQVRLHDVLEKVADSVAPIANEMYREIGIRSHGKGIFHKEPVSGELLGNKRVYRVVAGCLTLNIVFAWERSLAVTTERESGMIASHRFPMFRPDPKRTLAEYVLLHLLSQKGSEALGLASPGGAGRNRTLSQTVFLKTPISLPPLDEQRQIVDFVQAADHEIDLLKKQLAALKEQKKGLMQKLLTGEVRVKLPKGVA